MGGCWGQDVRWPTIIGIPHNEELPSELNFLISSQTHDIKTQGIFCTVFLWISKIYLDFQGSTTVYIKRKLHSLVFITLPRVFHHLENSMANHKGSHIIWKDNQQLSVCICSSCFPSDPTSTLKYTYLVFTSHVKYKEAVFMLSSWPLSPFL